MIHYRFFCDVNPLPKNLNRKIIRVNSMNELQFSHHFQYVKDCEGLCV